MSFFESDFFNDMPKAEREERKNKIEEFQFITGYTKKVSYLPDNISDIMSEKYDMIQNLSDEIIDEIQSKMEKFEEARKIISNQYQEKYDRIFKWAKSPNQLSYKIVKIFLENRNKSLSANDFILLLKSMDVNKNPYGSVRSMMSDAGNSYGRIFMEDCGVLVLIPELQDRLPEILKDFDVE